MIKFGIIGMGIRGKMYADTIEKNPYATIQAVTDVNPESLKAAVEKYNTKGYDDFEAMFEKESLDAVIIATPDFLHKKPVMLAAQNGIHILVEKPFSTKVEETEEMSKAIEENNVKCLVGFENRWNSPFVAVKQAIDHGEIGQVVTLNSRLNDTIYVPTKMLKWSAGSTPGWFLLSHSIDMGCWLKQGVKPTKVFAVGTKKKLIQKGIDTYDSIQATISFEDNTHATFTTSWILPESMPMIYDFKYEIIGEEGSYQIDLSDQMVHHAGNRYEHVHTLGTPVNGAVTYAPGYMLNAFIDNIRLDTEPIAGPQDGLLNTKLVHLIHRSIESGEVQKLR